MQTEMSARETLKMVRCTGLASTLGVMGQDMKAAGAKVRDLEQDIKDSQMESFTEAAGQMAKGMASVFIGILMAISFKGSGRMIKSKVFI